MMPPGFEKDKGKPEGMVDDVFKKLTDQGIGVKSGAEYKFGGTNTFPGKEFNEGMPPGFKIAADGRVLKDEV